MVLFSTLATIEPLPSSTRAIPKLGLFVMLVASILPVIWPVSDALPVTATLMPAPWRTVAVLLVTLKVPAPVVDERLIADWPTPPPVVLVKVHPVIVAS